MTTVLAAVAALLLLVAGGLATWWGPTHAPVCISTEYEGPCTALNTYEAEVQVTELFLSLLGVGLLAIALVNRP